MQKKQKPVSKHVCLFITLSDEGIKELLSKAKAKDITEVVIKYNGKEKTMTFKTLFKKLGF